ncbi:unnamed protein product [Rotaria sp. Silwood2]|nr:unnamed protein product [Rotaria sp. Silwood2]
MVPIDSSTPKTFGETWMFNPECCFDLDGFLTPCKRTRPPPIFFSYDPPLTFSNLNDRFQQLLNSSAVLFKIYIDDSKYNDTYMNKYEEFFRQNKHKILSLNIQLLKESNKYSSFFTVNSLFNCLESLIIDICESTRLIAILINLSCLPRLFSLTIELPCSTKILNDTYRIIFTLSTLKTCRLKGWKNEESISLPMASNQKLNTLKYLTIDHHCTLNELYIIISYTPQLHRLNLLYDFEIDSNIKTILPIKLSNLTSISLHMNRVNFDEFEIFIKKLYSYLKILRITNQSKDITFLNAHRWEQLVLQCIPQLEEFDLQYYEQRNDQFDYSSYTRESDQFISSFWIERKWIFEIEINNESINYLIHPYRKRWYENCNSIPDLTKFTRLTLTYILPDSLHESVIVDIKRVLTIAQVYHLEIPEENIFIGALIEALNLVPELNTLKIYSLSLYEPRNLSFEEYMILCSIEDISPGKLKWNRTATTIIGGYGTGPNQLNYPNGIFIESKTKILYIADVGNHRVQKRYPNGEIITAAGDPHGRAGIQYWQRDAQNGTTVAGNESLGAALNEFHFPTRVLVGSKKNIIVADSLNQQIMQWTFPYDPKKNVGTIIAGGNGAGLNPYQLNNPNGLYLDEHNQILYISNEESHSITQWVIGDYEPRNIYAGIPGRSGDSAIQLYRPQGITLDRYGNLYVSDSYNNRVQMFCPNSVFGITVAGTGDAGSSSNQLSYPQDITFDSEMNLYVTDTHNFRIQKFDRIQ